MAVSTISLEYVIDVLAAKGIPDPRNQASGYGDALALELASKVMADIITERLNQKFNRRVAAPFNTNGWQQDYPQIAQPNGIIGWGEECDIVDINNPTLPKPLNWDGGALTVRRGLTRTSQSRWRPKNICWMYNSDLSWGTWPGANVTYYPLITTGTVSQNPIMNFIDAAGNYLILTGFGTTGANAPAAPPDSAEGVTVNDGSCVWTVVSGTSQGWRLDVLPNVGQTFQLIPYYQCDPIRFTVLGQMLTPIPDSFSQTFFDGYEAYMYTASQNPGDQARGQKALTAWLNALGKNIKQGDREPNIYQLIPQSMPVESRWDSRGPYTADDPV